MGLARRFHCELLGTFTLCATFSAAWYTQSSAVGIEKMFSDLIKESWLVGSKSSQQGRLAGTHSCGAAILKTLFTEIRRRN